MSTLAKEFPLLSQVDIISGKFKGGWGIVIGHGKRAVLVEDDNGDNCYWIAVQHLTPRPVKGDDMTNIDYAALRVALAQAPDRPHTFYLAARTALPALLDERDETQRRIDAIRKLAAEAEHLLSCREAEAKVEAESGAEYRPAAYSAYGALREAETLRAVLAILTGAEDATQ